MRKQSALAFSIPTETENQQQSLFGRFREFGFNGLQLKSGQYLRYLDEPNRFQDEWGLDPGQVSGLIFGDDLADGGARLRSVIRFANRVGSERVIFCHGQSRLSLTGQRLKEYAQQLSAIAGDARTQDVALSLHNHFDQPVMTENDLERFFSHVEDDTLTLTVDTAHFAKSGVEEIAPIIRNYESFLDNVHLKDIFNNEFKTLGEGEIEFAPIFQALQAIEYSGWLCADEESGAGIVDGMNAASAFIRERVRAAELLGGKING